jgi:hypothetical protein
MWLPAIAVYGLEINPGEPLNPGSGGVHQTISFTWQINDSFTEMKFFKRSTITIVCHPKIPLILRHYLKNLQVP